MDGDRCSMKLILAAARVGRTSYLAEMDFEWSFRTGGWLAPPDNQAWGGRFGPSLLELALKYGQWEVVEWLLGKNIHISTRNLHTLVCHAARNAETKRLQALLPQSIIIRLTLRAAAEAGDLQGVKRLMQDLDKQRPPNSGDLGNFLCSAADLATKHGHAEVAKRLIGHEYVQGDETLIYNVFQFAAENDQPELLHILLGKKYFAVVRSSWTLTFLHLAAQSGSTSCFQLLLKRLNMDVNAVFFPELFTPLHVAAYYGHVNVVRLLLECKTAGPAFPSKQDKHGASTSLSPMKIDSLGRTALHTAAAQGCLPVVLQLLDRIKVDHRDYDGMTALHLAACAGHTDVVRELVRRSGCPNMKANAFTSQMLLLHNVLTERMSLLQSELMGDPDIMSFPRPSVVKSVFWSPGGFSPLHFAAVYERKEVVEELLKEDKIDVFLEDDEGLTAYDWAQVVGLGQTFLECLDASRKGELVRKTSGFKLDRAKSFHEEAKRLEQKKKEVEWCYEMGKAVTSRQWVVARGLVSQVSILKVKIDNSMWDHLVWALEVATTVEAAGMGKEAPKKRKVVHVKDDELEEIVLLLLKAEAFWSETLQSCLMWAIREERVRVAERLMVSEEVNCNLSTPHVEGGLYEAHSTPLEYATHLKRRKIVQLMEQREDVKRAMYEDRQVCLDYANTILVGAVLIAALAYQGWLQPPLGYRDSHVDTQDPSVRLFTWFNSFGFFLAMATVIAAATGAMPTPTGQLVDAKRKVHNAVSVASVLLIAAVVCVTVAFTAAGLAVLAPFHRDRRMMHISLGIGTVLSAFLLFWFIIRLIELVTGIPVISNGLIRIRGISNLLKYTFKRFILMPCIHCGGLRPPMDERFKANLGFI